MPHIKNCKKVLRKRVIKKRHIKLADSPKFLYEEKKEGELIYHHLKSIKHTRQIAGK